MTIKIGCDVDLVLAQSDYAWWEWLCNVTNCDRLMEDYHTDYDLSVYFKEDLNYLKVDPMGFWRSTNTYDYVFPVLQSQWALRKLKKELDCEIIAISHVKGNSNKSKYQFLQRHFKNELDGYVATHEKHYVNVDYMIDDRVKYLNKFDNKTTCIRLDTPYNQCCEPTREITVKKDWKEIVEFMLREEMK